MRRPSAGGLLWRSAGGNLEIAVIRDPATRRWNLPRGRPRPGESLPEAAMREVAEETGFKFELGPKLGTVVEADLGGPLKAGAYWWMRVTGGRFKPNSEADRLRWVTPATAAGILEGARDRAAIRLLSRAGALKKPA